MRDMIERAGWTAAESFLAVVIGSGVLDLSITTLEAAAISAMSAGITVVFVWVRQKRAEAEAKSDIDI